MDENRKIRVHRLESLAAIPVLTADIFVVDFAGRVAGVDQVFASCPRFRILVKDNDLLEKINQRTTWPEVLDDYGGFLTSRDWEAVKVSLLEIFGADNLDFIKGEQPKVTLL